MTIDMRLGFVGTRLIVGGKTILLVFCKIKVTMLQADVIGQPLGARDEKCSHYLRLKSKRLVRMIDKSHVTILELLRN